jgi:pteridine reductase
MPSALITGSAVRIGKEIAIYLAKSGYNIALHYNNSSDEVQLTKKEIIKFNVNCGIFKKDLSLDPEGFIAEVKNKFPDLCLIINSASIFIKSKISGTSFDLFNDVFNINFRSPFFLTKEFADICKRGNIINIIDTKISINNSGYAVYTLSKKILAEFTKMSAKEFAPGIRINGIAPGLILPPENETEKYLDDLAVNVPLKKKGNVENILKSIEFILNNDYITGQVIFVDGGQHL